MERSPWEDYATLVGLVREEGSGVAGGTAMLYRALSAHDDDRTILMIERYWRGSIVAVLTLLCLSVAGWAQGPEDGGHEVQVWTGGGYTVPGGTKSTGVWNLGARYGWVLTRPHGPGFLSGRFEYAVDAVPVFLVFQPRNTAYGAGFNPIDLKWNFATRGSLVPYLEIDGGTLFTNHSVPTGTNAVNFTSSGVFGMHVLGARWNWSVEARYMHISNAGLATPNPGINTFQVRLGVGKFLGARHK